MSDSTSSANYQDAGASQSWRERKTLLIAGGVGTAVVVALGAYFLLFSGSSGDTAGGVVPNANHPHVVLPTPAATATLPAVYKADPYGNPFAPIYAAAPTATATDATATGGGSGSGAAGVPQGVPSAAPANTGSDSGPPPATTKTVKVKLVKVVNDNTVTVSVNGAQPFATKTGVTFAGVFSLRNTRPSEGEATFNYGDGDPFTLGTGESKTVSVSS